MRVLIDTNVVLDYILNREPYGDYAQRIVDSDFEDCLQMECAKEYHADYIVTRNTADFAASNIPCMESEQMCALLENDI